MVNAFSHRIKPISWPGDKALSSEEYQLVNRFYALLDECQQTDCVLASLSCQAMAYQIKIRCQRTVFQPQSPPARIHILGTLESAGLPFTHAWFAHCHSKQWPQAPKPNPFIALSVQRAYRMQHCDATRELEFATTILTRLQHTVGTLYCSYSAYADDNSQLPSPLLNDFPICEPTALNMTQKPTLAEQLVHHEALEYHEDTHGKPLINTQLTGSTHYFKDHSACPFRAYVKYRLYAREPWPISTLDGFSALQRGQLIHKALELAWRELRNHANLIKLSATEQDACAKRWAKAAFQQLQIPLMLPASPTLIQIEIHRLNHLVNAWLTQERDRPPFSVIALEKRVH